ncbi:MAG: DUF4435 domain-containing protein [Rikenellaceae bacterium]|nr:DUF4435 domain-containing protein [Rikenellaceae bacterium]
MAVDGVANAQKRDGLERFRLQSLGKLPRRLPRDPAKMHVEVFVEGYEDVSFWRGIFDDYESESITFEINVPPRADLAKGKKVLLGMYGECSPERLLCLDSDFDYLFGTDTRQSETVNSTPYMFHTYAYATENYLCYAPSLHNVCVKATKNDTRIFDSERFIAEYSAIIYPLFLWYAYSARHRNENIFTLNELRSSVKLNYLEIDDNGASTLKWLERQVSKRLDLLEKNRPGWDSQLAAFGRDLAEKGVTPETTYLYMQGHTLMDNVVIIMLNAVCDTLKQMSNLRISASTKTGTALRNEISNYNNALRNVRDVLLDNESYKDCPLYGLLRSDIENYLRDIGMLGKSRL